MKIAQALDVRLRDRDVLLLSAGYAPAYSQAAWNSGQMQSRGFYPSPHHSEEGPQQNSGTGASFLLASSGGQAAGFLLIIERTRLFLNSSSTTFGFTSWR